jgi:hypothetical protein
MLSFFKKLATEKPEKSPSDGEFPSAHKDIDSQLHSSFDPLPEPDVKESNSDSVWAAFDSIGDHIK